MQSKKVREKYLKFFNKNGHKQIDPAPLVLEDDSTTLFISAGMQSLVPNLMGEPHPKGKRLVNSQPSLRTNDIEKVGDNRHLTFFEMLGNWSLGDYFKEEQLAFVWKFFTKELGLPKNKLWVTVFEGNKNVPKDIESFEIWKRLGVPEKRILCYGAKKNWWSRSGTLEQMPVGEIGGPDSEIFYEFSRVKHDKNFGDECHPNCNCGKFIEIGNSVFIQYEKVGEGKLEELPNKNVDFGGGLERITAAVADDPDVFKTDIFKGLIEKIRGELNVNVEFGEDSLVEEDLRIIADHLRASAMIISNGILPSNKAHGYVLRKLIRRAVLRTRFIDRSGDVRLPSIDFSDQEIPIKILPASQINKVIDEEEEKFRKALDRGMKKLMEGVVRGDKNTVDFTFDLYQTEGFPIEISKDILEKEGKTLSQEEEGKIQEKIEKHKEKSRTSSAEIFKGGLAGNDEKTIKLHTATHLLLSSLKEVLGDHVVQKGQNITEERSRFDFSHPKKLSEEELRKVENVINKTIKKDLPVNSKIMTKKEALKTGATHGFDEKYTDTVKVYFIGESFKDAFSKEFCGGPHAKSTGEISRVRIKKQEKIGSGIVRIYTYLS